MKKFKWLLVVGAVTLNCLAIGCSNNPGEADPKGEVAPEQQEQMDTDVGKVPNE